MEAFVRGPGDVFHMTREPDDSLAPLVNVRWPGSVPRSISGGVSGPRCERESIVFAGLRDGTLFAFDHYSHSQVHRYTPSTNSWVAYEDIIGGVTAGVCVGPEGHILATSEEHFGLSILSPTGRQILTRWREPGWGVFEAPGTKTPFWESGARSVAATMDSFIIGGGGEMPRIDHYALSGRYLGSIDSIRVAGVELLHADAFIDRLVFGPQDEVWARLGLGIVRLTLDGQVLGAWDLDDLCLANLVPALEWFMVDHLGRLWTVARQGGHLAGGEEGSLYMVCLAFT